MLSLQCGSVLTLKISREMQNGILCFHSSVCFSCLANASKSHKINCARQWKKKFQQLHQSSIITLSDIVGLLCLPKTHRHPICHLPCCKWIVRWYLHQSWETIEDKAGKKDYPAVCVCMCAFPCVCACMSVCFEVTPLFADRHPSQQTSWRPWAIWKYDCNPCGDLAGVSITSVICHPGIQYSFLVQVKLLSLSASPITMGDSSGGGVGSNPAKVLA